jgi:thioesterase domain-containing protein
MARHARSNTAGEPLFVTGSDQLRAGAVTSVITSYEPRPFSGPIALFGTPTTRAKAGDELLGWRDLVGGEVTPESIEGDHLSILRKPDVDQLVRTIPPLLQRHQGLDHH